MNNDDTLSDQNTKAGTELEARIVAYVLGEASAFETAELERLLSTQPELAVFKRRIEAVNGLVSSAVRPDQAPMRLAPERRVKLLQAIGGVMTQAKAAESAEPIVVKFADARRKRRRRYIWTSAIAACLTFAAVVTMNVPRQSKHRIFHEEQMAKVELPLSVSVNSEETDEDTSAVSSSKRANKPGAFSAPSVPRVAVNPSFPLGSVGHEEGRSKLHSINLEPSQVPSGLLDQNGISQPKVKGIAASANFGRPNISLNDSASSVRILPQPLLKDIGAKNSSDALTFTAEVKESIAFDSYNKLEDKASPDPLGKGRIAKDDAENEAPIVLSEMEVTAAADVGYMASNTLAGSRVGTRLNSFHVNSGPRFAQAQTGTDTSAFAGDDDFLGFAKNTNTDPLRQKWGAESNTPAAIDERLSKENRVAAAPPAETQSDSPQREINTAAEPVSTFSLHVSDVSFRLAQAALARGETPDPARIRPEEFYNAFDYADPAPSTGEKIGSRIEQSAHPFLQQRNFIRIATKVASTGRGASQPLHLTVLLDTSGSMEREDRIVSVRSALQTLGSLLTANDRVTLIGFARQPRLLAEALPGDQAGTLVELASQTPFTGGTNLEEALNLAAELAQRHFNRAAQNRIVLITDGAANLGNADPAQLATTIETVRQQGIAFDACGVGTDGLDDSILEALTRKGDGRYYLLDDSIRADGTFARQLAGAFRPAAENVKVQVRFNPARVGRYRLIGFEQHRLREEDFRNDQVDAAELAADEAAVALYQVEVLPDGEGELGQVFVRFRDPASREMVERSWPILHEAKPRAFDRASPSIQLAGTAALLAEKLRGGEWAEVITLDELAPIANTLRGHYAHQVQVQQLVGMFEQMRRQQNR